MTRGPRLVRLDRIFRQQAAIDHNIKWNSIHPSIQAATLVQNSGTLDSFCTLCHEVDHSAKSCAMNFLQVPVSQQMLLLGRPTKFQMRWQASASDNICMSWN